MSEYQPEGRIENLLVERIAICFWKLKRALRAEHGELSKEAIAAGDRLVVAEHDDFESGFAAWAATLNEQAANGDLKKAPSTKQAIQNQMIILGLRRTHEGNSLVRDMLQKVRDEIEKEGSLSDKNRRLIVELLGDPWVAIVTMGKFQDPEARKNLLLSIDGKLTELKSRDQYLTARDAMQKNAELLRAIVPTDGSTDRILRCESHVERQLYRAMDQLDRLQRRRKGEWVPAPVKLEIGGT